MSLSTQLKNRLLKHGPNSRLVRQAFRLQAALHGISMHVEDEKISLTRGSQRVVLATRDAISVPFIVHQWDLFKETLTPERHNGHDVLDFSRPRLHHYRKTGISFYAPGIAEDDCMDAYTDVYSPNDGDVVWDVGANAGMSSYLFAQMVGPTGKVYAFEPDETNYGFLVRNIEMHKLSNVIPVKAALSDKTGTANFCMDGTMGAGLSDFLQYSASDANRLVQTLSFEDASKQFGAAPTYVKLDIEGAEITVIASALDFLRSHPIYFAIESNHVVDGDMTSGPLEDLFKKAGYHAWSSDEYGQRFTWAKPRQ